MLNLFENKYLYPNGGFRAFISATMLGSRPNYKRYTLL